MKIFLLLIIFILSANLQAQDLANLKGQKPIIFSGGINLNISTYNNLSGKTDRLDPFSWTLSATPTATIYGVQVPIFFLLNKQSRSLTGPFQQFGLSPTYKWARLHLGYRNITFSPYTLGGRLFNGVGLELNPGKLRFGATYGQFQKAEIGYLAGVGTVTPNLPNGISPAYKRMGFAMKLGYGSEQNFFDISVLKIQDDASSLTVPKDFAKVTPDENVVLGITNQFTFFKRLFWKNDLAASIYTRDVRSAVFSNEKLDKFPIVKNFISPRTGSSLGYAGETALGVQFDKFGLQAQYKLISLDYQSMGAYFFNTDVEEITVSGSATLANGKVQAAGTYGVQNDNVSKIKEFTTQRKIGSANINLQFSQTLGLSINYSNFGTTQNLQQRVIDTLKIAQVNQSLMIAPRWFKMMGKTSHSVNGVLSYQNANDLNTVSKVQTDFNNIFASISYAYGRPVQKITLTPGLIYIKNLLPIYNTTSVGVSFMAQKGSKKNNLSSSLSVNYTNNSQNGEANGSTLNARLNSSYKLTAKQQFNLSVSTIVNSDKKIERRNFQELYMNAGYGINF